MFEKNNPPLDPDPPELTPETGPSPRPVAGPAPEPKIVPAPEGIEDILGETEPVKGPVSPVAGARAEPETVLAPEIEGEEGVGFFQRYWLILVISALVVIGITGLLVFVLSRPKAAGQPLVNVPLNKALETTTNLSVNAPAPQAPIDTDSDGLSDEEEALAGTLINNPDTDSDGLTDYEEVKIYKTNPLNADTDGDGFLDGNEVKGGFDPNLGGGAKLLNLNNEINKLNQK